MEEKELDLEPIEERLSKATPGPWNWVVGEWVELSHGTGDDLELVMAFPRGSFGGHRPYDENREFIAKARTDIPDLVAEIKRLRREVNDYFRLLPH
jgi:hypothetical protein